MAQRCELEPEVQEIFDLIDSGKHFLLSGGAGSGKTYSLVQVIQQALEENPNSKIACMTYTNAAVKEIEERVNHDNLSVSTIHDFLWNNIRHFQKELKSSLIELIADEESAIKSPEGVDVEDGYFEQFEEGIQYKEFLRVRNGIISHDEVLILAEYMYNEYPKLCDILKDKFKFVFVDEYQDTSPKVVEILLNHLRKSSRGNTIGFFGDAMQSIYPDGIGELNEYLGNDDFQLNEVKKTQNRRNPQKVIDLANELRADSITQVPSNDENAPNMLDGSVVEGSVRFYYSTDPDVEKVKEATEWDYFDTKETKILNLTHNLIAPNAGFDNLMEIYDKDKVLDYRNRIKKYIKDNEVDIDTEGLCFGDVVELLKQGKSGSELNKVLPTKGMNTYFDENSEAFASALQLPYDKLVKVYLDKDQLIDDKKQDAEEESKKGSKRDALIKHLFKIEKNISLYNLGAYNEFLRITDYQVRSIEDKRALKSKIESLINVGSKSIEDVINLAHESGVCQKEDKLEEFILNNFYTYNRVKNVQYSEFQNLFRYLEGYLPYSTQHKTKGAEFNSVLVILDNGKWNSYNFENLFTGTGTESVLERTQKIFYVCCTRAKLNLAVFFHNPEIAILETAKNWFGAENVINLDLL